MPTARVTLEPSARRSNSPTVVTSPQSSAVQIPTGRTSQEAHAATTLSYVVGGLIGLWVLYQLHRWFQYKIRKVIEDKKLLAELALVGDQTTKPRYPMYEALFTMVGVNIKPDPPAILISNVPEDEAEDALKPRVVARKKRETKGAYINGPDFVDLEANESRVVIPMSADAALNTAQKTAEENVTDNSSSKGKHESGGPRYLLSTRVLTSAKVFQNDVAALTSSGSAPSVYFSDESSFLKDIVNAQVVGDANNSDVSSVSDNDTSKSSSTGSRSED